MHLTFVGSDGLEQAALSLIASPGTSSDTKMKQDRQNTFFSGGGGESGGEDSESDSEFYVIDENSPLLSDLDPPGTKTSYMGDGWGKQPNKSPFSISRKGKTEKLPWVIVLTAIGMAAMVIVGFITMFQGPASVTNFATDESANTTGLPLTIDGSPSLNGAVNGSDSTSTLLNISNSSIVDKDMTNSTIV